MTKKKDAGNAAPKISIQEFNRVAKLDKEREECAICALPADVKAELRSAVDKGIKLPMRVRFLQEVCGVEGDAGALSNALRKHLNARHEEGLYD
uniref:Uncharacterized protein n=1 Tax=viral metagenome TaxID=1070528 RepID=A0A6M3KVS5_9ZZZZ